MSSNYLLKKGLLLSYEEDLSLAAMHRLIKKSGASRVSETACRELAKVLEEIGVSIGKEALEFMMYAGRKTVKGKDIKIAAKKTLDIVN
jgi:histone H3/H4